jgi:hypothetical protein
VNLSLIPSTFDAVRYFVSTLFLLVVASMLSLGQARTTKKAQTFKWDWHKTQTAKNTVTKNAEITAAERASLLAVLMQQFARELQPKALAAETRIKLVDLNRDGVPEIVAQAVGDLCSPTGNCPFWVFQKSASGYKLILERDAVQSFTIQPTRTNAYFDVVLGMHGSATERGLYLYEFSQGRYRRVACYAANWTYLDENHEIHELEEPLITPCQ